MQLERSRPEQSSNRYDKIMRALERVGEDAGGLRYVQQVRYAFGDGEAVDNDHAATTEKMKKMPAVRRLTVPDEPAYELAQPADSNGHDHGKKAVESVSAASSHDNHS